MFLWPARAWFKNTNYSLVWEHEMYKHRRFLDPLDPGSWSPGPVFILTQSNSLIHEV